MNPLSWTRSIKMKFSIVIVAAIGTAVVTSQVGYSLGWPIWIRPTIAAAVSIVAVQFLARGMTRPLSDMAVAARHMANGDYEQRVHTSSVDEVGQLATAFNRMAESVADADRQQRDLIGNVSHELRTPITGLRATIENIIDGITEPTPAVLASMAERVERLQHLIGDLLDLSRLESGMVPIQKVDLHVADVVRVAVDECRAACPCTIITADIPHDLQVSADPERLHQVLTNLLYNAVKHGGGNIDISAQELPKGIAIDVADRGTGLPVDVDLLFGRFYRADSTSPGSGTGLGLAIVRWIVELHGGTVRAVPNQPNGARFIVTLPTV